MSTKNTFFSMSINCQETAKYTIDNIINGSIEMLITLNDDNECCDLNPQLLLLTVLNIEKLKNLVAQKFNTPITHYMELKTDNEIGLIDSINTYLQGCIELLNLLMVGGNDNDKGLMLIMSLNFESIKDLIKGIK